MLMFAKKEKKMDRMKVFFSFFSKSNFVDISRLVADIFSMGSQHL